MQIPNFVSGSHNDSSVRHFVNDIDLYRSPKSPKNP